MFTKLKKVFVIATLLLGAQTAQADFFGFRATVKAIDPLNLSHHQTTVSDFNYDGCEQKRLDVISNEFAAYNITDHGVCMPVFAGPQELQEIPVFSKGPVCLTCPYLMDSFIELILPEEQVYRAHDLIERYKIDTYNAELHRLQERYDLEGFEREMYELENAATLKEQF